MKCSYCGRENSSTVETQRCDHCGAIASQLLDALQMSFCRRCGTRQIQVSYDPQRFDPDTGKELKQDVCPNSKCYMHCEQFDGHNWIEKGWFIFKYRTNCANCGISVRDTYGNSY
jgi:ribosomal protein L37E